MPLLSEIARITGGRIFMKDSKVSERYHVEEYSPSDFYVEDPSGGDSTGPFKTKQEAQRECDKRNQATIVKDSISYAEYSRQKKTLEDEMKDLLAQGESSQSTPYKNCAKELEQIEKDYNTKDSVKDAVELPSGQKVIPGWYVMKNDRPVRGPFSESQCHKEANENRGEEAGYISDYDIKRMNQDSTSDSVLSDLVGLAKKAGEALMEPTEKAAAGDTKDADTEWFLENEDTGKKVKGPFATEQEAISVHRSLRGSYKEWEKLFVTEERKG